MSGGKDKQILFHRILPSTTRGPPSTTAIDWHLKVKDIEYSWSNQNLLHHSQDAKNLLNS